MFYLQYIILDRAPDLNVSVAGFRTRRLYAEGEESVMFLHKVESEPD